MSLFSNKKTVNTLVKLCIEAGLQEVVVSPGSRNAPLLFSFDACSIIRTITIVDERSAAFFALGMAQQLQRPVGLVCTSGTATLNYAPAIAEAYYQHIPLVIITADRPEEWIDQADGQTIRQHNIYENYIGFSCTLPSEINSSTDERIIIRKVSQAFNRCYRQNRPVHINVPLSEPLYGRQKELDSNARLIKQTTQSPNTKDIDLECLNLWEKAEKKMILVGQNNSLNFELASAKMQDTVILTETTSNYIDKDIINCIDRTLASVPANELTFFAPDILITFGGQVISKNIKSFLRKNPPKEHWHISLTNDFPDTYLCLTKTIKANPNDFLSKLHYAEESNFKKVWLQQKEIAQYLHDLFIKNCQWCDLKVFSILTKNIPAGTMLQLSNSTPVRYAQLFENYNNDISCYANRGTSGIDGCTSTAVGAAFASEKPTLLITGDLSFFYDSNALWNNYIRPDFKIIVINNGGGGIFRFVSEASQKEMQNYFEVSQDLSCKHLAACFNLDYNCCENERELEAILPNFFNSNDKPQLLEIRTIGIPNGEILKSYFNAMQ
jgi:2-succinyl-5-enolpyruvyl-6-hydroxy-3-cyclohexene-1-carboxylate synthase